MAKLTLGSYKLTTSSKRDALATLRRKYVDLGLKQRTDFLSKYGAYKGADELFEDFPQRLEQALAEATQAAASDIAAQRVYHLDLATIRSNLIEHVETIWEPFEQLEKSYRAIVGNADLRDAQFEDAKENRPQLVGGGFGVEGAAKGIAMAAAANAAINLTAGLANLASKAVSGLGDSRKKRALFTDPNTRVGLADFLQEVVAQGHLVVAEAVNAASATAPYDIVTESAKQKSVGLVENVAAGRVPDNDVGDVLIEAIQLDPFSIAPWSLWVDRFGDSDRSVARSAERLGVGSAIEAHKEERIAERNGQLSWTTPEECQSSSIVLENLSEFLGADFSRRRAEIETKSKLLDERRRSVNGVLYETVAAADAAKIQIANELEIREKERREAEDRKARTYNQIEYGSIEEAKIAKRNYYWTIEKRALFIVGSFFMAIILLSVLIDHFNPPQPKIEDTPEPTETPLIMASENPKPQDTNAPSDGASDDASVAITGMPTPVTPEPPNPAQ